MAKRLLTEAQKQAQYDYLHNDEFDEARDKAEKSDFKRPDYAFVNESGSLAMEGLSKSVGIKNIEQKLRESLSIAEKELGSFHRNDLQFFNLGELYKIGRDYRNTLDGVKKIGRDYLSKDFYGSQELSEGIRQLFSDKECRNPNYCQTVQVYRGMLGNVNKAIISKLETKEKVAKEKTQKQCRKEHAMFAAEVDNELKLIYELNEPSKPDYIRSYENQCSGLNQLATSDFINFQGDLKENGNLSNAGDTQLRALMKGYADRMEGLGDLSVDYSNISGNPNFCQAIEFYDIMMGRLETEIEAREERL